VKQAENLVEKPCANCGTKVIIGELSILDLREK